VYRRSAIGDRIPLQLIFGNDLLLVVEMAAVGRIVQIDEALYYERISAGARTASVPLYMRAQYYEPSCGISCILFHRVRVLMRYWGIAMRQTRGVRGSLSTAGSMLRVMFDLHRMPIRDTREAISLAWALASTRRLRTNARAKRTTV
jgi:hypothetical protein